MHRLIHLNFFLLACLMLVGCPSNKQTLAPGTDGRVTSDSPGYPGRVLAQNGSGFPPNQALTLNFVYPDGSIHTQAKLTDAKGVFTHTFTVTAAIDAGWYEYFASYINTSAIEVETPRVRLWMTNPQLEVVPERVGYWVKLKGKGFSPNSNVVVHIKHYLPSAVHTDLSSTDRGEMLEGDSFTVKTDGTGAFTECCRTGVQFINTKPTNQVWYLAVDTATGYPSNPNDDLKINYVFGAVSMSGQAVPPADTPKPRIAFSSNRDGNDEVYMMNADGSGQTNLTNNPASDYGAAWSPDGTKIAFCSDRDGNGEVYVMNADGSGQTNLTRHPGEDYGAAWSPDGTRIAFVSTRDGPQNSEIYVMNADGSGQTNLTNRPEPDDMPRWAPANRIVFAAWNADLNYDIYVMNADGSQRTRLTNSPAHDWTPTWSPDGSRIAFLSQRSGNGDLYVMNADGSNQVALTNSPAVDHQPAWSSDGTQIAFSSERDGNNEIYVMNADGSGQTNLSNNPASDTWPVWSQ